MELILDLQQKQRELDISIKQLRTTGTAYAQAEKDYKILLRTEALKLRADGMAIGMIAKIIYGVPEVAELRFKRDVNETIWKANQEAINSIKLQLRLISSQIDREWNNTK
jgi:ribosomal protein L31E